MLDSQLIERKVEDFLADIFKPEQASNERLLQKKKFVLLSKLIADLFNCNNLPDCFRNVSNLIVLILNIYNEKFPVDIYSCEQEYVGNKLDAKCKNLMKQEFLID
jgi:hypothetical protein